MALDLKTKWKLVILMESGWSNQLLFRCSSFHKLETLKTAIVYIPHPLWYREAKEVGWKEGYKKRDKNEGEGRWRKNKREFRERGRWRKTIRKKKSACGIVDLKCLETIVAVNLCYKINLQWIRFFLKAGSFSFPMLFKKIPTQSCVVIL